MNQAQTILFDLGALTTIAGISYKCPVITDAEGNPLSGFVLVGKNSPEYRAIQREIRIENLAKSAQRQTDIDTKTPEGAAVVIDKVIENDQRVACAVVTGWFGFGANGQEVTFDRTQLPAIFDQMPAWRDKILTSLEKEGNFMPASSNA